MPNDESHDPWQSPPDWVPLADVTKWVEHQYKVSPDGDFIRAMIQAIKTRRLTYRIADLPRRRQGRNRPDRPDGFCTGENGSVIVENWDAVDPDWRAGTVAGWRAPGREPMRHAIQLEWRNFDMWGMGDIARLRTAQRQQAVVQQAEAPAGFMHLRDALAQVVERRDPKLCATMRRDDPEWQCRDPWESAPLGGSAPATARQLNFYHHSSMIAAVILQQRRQDMRAAADKLHRQSTRDVWAALISGTVPLFVVASGSAPVEIPPAEVLTHGAKRVLGDGEVLAIDKDPPHAVHTGAPAVASAAFMGWLKGDTMTPESAQRQAEISAQYPASAVVPNTDISKMPGALTAMEAVAWVVTRDPVVVWLANVENPRTAALVEEFVLPQKPGIEMLWLEQYWAAKNLGRGHSGDSYTIPAIREIVAAGQSGNLPTRATWTETGGRKDWTADDWRGITLQEATGARNALVPCWLNTDGMVVNREIRAWADLRFDRDAMLQLWPPTAAPAEPARASDEVCRAEIERLRPPEPAALEQAAAPPETPAPAARGEPATVGAVRLTIPNKPGNGGVKMAAAITAMVHAVEGKQITYAVLARMQQKALSGLYSNAGRTLLSEAREAALKHLAAAGYSDKAPT